MLSAGTVIAWTVGREFTDGTVVGLFAIAASRGSVARAKITGCLGWVTALILTQVTLSVLAGRALRLPASGMLRYRLTLTASGICLLSSLLPTAWVAT